MCLRPRSSAPRLFEGWRRSSTIKVPYYTEIHFVAWQHRPLNLPQKTGKTLSLLDPLYRKCVFKQGREVGPLSSHKGTLLMLHSTVNMEWKPSICVGRPKTQGLRSVLFFLFPPKVIWMMTEMLLTWSGVRCNMGPLMCVRVGGVVS